MPWSRIFSYKSNCVFPHSLWEWRTKRAQSWTTWHWAWGEPLWTGHLNFVFMSRKDFLQLTTLNFFRQFSSKMLWFWQCFQILSRPVKTKMSIRIFECSKTLKWKLSVTTWRMIKVFTQGSKCQKRVRLLHPSPKLQNSKWQKRIRLWSCEVIQIWSSIDFTYKMWFLRYYVVYHNDKIQWHLKILMFL